MRPKMNPTVCHATHQSTPPYKPRQNRGVKCTGGGCHRDIGLRVERHRTITPTAVVVDGAFYFPNCVHDVSALLAEISCFRSGYLVDGTGMLYEKNKEPLSSKGREYYIHAERDGGERRERQRQRKPAALQ